MKVSIPPSVALVLLVPVAVLAFFAVRTLALEYDALNIRRERLTKQHMDAAAELLDARLRRIGEDLGLKTLTAYERGGADALAALSRKRAFQFAAVFDNGVPLHSATALEHQYEFARLLDDRAQTLASGLEGTQGWHAELVAAGATYALMHCSSVGSPRVVCVVADSGDVERVLESAIGQIAEDTGLTRVDLIDPKGSILVGQSSGIVGDRSQPLSGLLQGWQLRAREASQVGGLQMTVLLYAAAGALIAGWILMTWMLYRSSLLKDEAAVARANVIAQLAHELRTPLTNLKLHTDLLRRKKTDPGSVERYANVLDGEIGRLSNLAENAISVARGDMASPRLEAANADDCVRAVLERFEPTLLDARCQVRFRPGANKTRLFDKTAWERCLINLIDNARKYAPGSEIEIATTLTSNELRLDVRDKGPGISIDHCELIFEPLQRGGTTKASGFGLGLAAVRAMARQNGGNCWLERESLGAHFVVTIEANPAGPIAEAKVS